MRGLRVLVRRLAGLFHKARREREMAEEIESNLQLHIADNVRAGMAPEEARRQALVQLGGIEPTKEGYRERSGLPLVETFLQDLRYGVRLLRRNPGFTVVAVLTLALGIGANTAVFSVVNAVLLRPLPYEQPQQLVKIWGRFTKFDLPQNWISEPEWWDMRDSLRSFAGLAAYNSGGGANLSAGGSGPVRVSTTQASGDLFAMLGVQPVLGRAITPDDDRPGHEKVAVIDYGFWQSRLGGERGILGRTLELDGQAYTVVGVLPKGFNLVPDTDVWLPLALDRAKPGGRGSHYLDVVGRLRPGVSEAQGNAELEALARDTAKKYPNNYGSDSGFGMFLRPLHAELVGDARQPLVVIFAAVLFVLLIACVNLANLLLARGTVRGREMALRSALGAGRWRLVRQLATESLAIAGLGGAAGVVLALGVLRVLRGGAVTALPAITPIRLDTTVLLFSGVIALLSALLFGLTPALQLTKQGMAEALKDAAPTTSRAAGNRLRGALVIAEISLALVLLVAAGLMVRSLERLLAVSPGFQPEHLMTARVSLPADRYPTAAASTGFYRELAQRVAALPSVQATGMASLLPMTGHSSGTVMAEHTAVSGLPISAQFHLPSLEADLRAVTPGYLEAMRVRLMRGRTLSDTDASGASLVAVVDEELARRFWPDRNPLGERIAFGTVPNSNPPEPQWRTVVGVVGHVKNDSLDQQGREQTYVPVEQVARPVKSMYLAVRAEGDPKGLAGSIRAQVAQLDPSLPLYDVKTMDEWLDQSLSPRRFDMMLLVLFAALALVLAAIGTYGVISYAANQRTREIGIRMALGASRSDVLRLVIAGGLRLAGLGILIGAALALLATRAMTTLLFGVRPSDPVTFAAVAALLGATALLAAYVPARRAMKVDPMEALRYE